MTGPKTPVKMPGQENGKHHKCPACGHRQPSGALVHIYRICYHCKHEVVPASALEVPSDAELDKSGKLRITILAASYGHITDPFRAILITKKLQELVITHPKRPDVLYVSKATNLCPLLGHDPYPEGIKALKVRYYMSNVRGEFDVRESHQGYLTQDLILKCPKEPRLLTIYDATYGPRGSGSYDANGLINVKEKICGLADLGGGSFVSIPHTFPLMDLFGLPCGEDRKKHLSIRYEIEGRQGKVQRYDYNARLNAPLEIKAAVPKLEPLLLIHSAYYGWTREMIKARAQDIQQELQEIYRIQSLKAAGVELTNRQNEILKKAPILQAELEKMIREGTKCYDVTYKTQRRVEAAGGDLIHFPKGADDFNALFGRDPYPGKPKELRIKYTSIGNDADRMTTSEELTIRGFQRNIIKNFDGEVGIPVLDDPVTGGSFAQEEAKITSQKAFPLLDVLVAKYGIPSNALKMKDVTKDVRRLVLKQGGWQLEIPVEQDLDELFGKSYVQGRKELIVAYMLRGIVGLMRVEELNGFLRSSLCLGYPTSVKYEEEDQEATSKRIKELEDDKQLDLADLRVRLQTMRGYEKGASEQEKRHPPTAVHLYCKTVKKGPKVEFEGKDRTLTERIVEAQREFAKTQGTKIKDPAVVEEQQRSKSHKGTGSEEVDDDVEDTERDDLVEGLYCTYNAQKLAVDGGFLNEQRRERRSGGLSVQMKSAVDDEKLG